MAKTVRQNRKGVEVMELEKSKEYLRCVIRNDDPTDEVKALSYFYSVEAIDTVLQELDRLQKENEEFLKNYISKEKIMKYKKEAENAECKNTLEAVCIGAIIGVLDGLLEE